VGGVRDPIGGVDENGVRAELTTGQACDTRIHADGTRTLATRVRVRK